VTKSTRKWTPWFWTSRWVCMSVVSANTMQDWDGHQKLLWVQLARKSVIAIPKHLEGGVAICLLSETFTAAANGSGASPKHSRLMVAPHRRGFPCTLPPHIFCKELVKNLLMSTSNPCLLHLIAKKN
jgi:hypothetical protein